MKYSIITIYFLMFSQCHCNKGAVKTPIDDKNISKGLDFFNGDIKMIAIDELQIDLLEGLPPSMGLDESMTSIPIDENVEISLDNVKYTFDDKTGMLKLTVIRKDVLKMAQGEGEIVDKSPYPIQGAIKFNNIYFTKGGKRIPINSKTLEVLNHRVQKYKLQFDASDYKYTKLNKKIKDLEGRILHLLEDIKILERDEPEHAGRELPPTLNKLLKTVRDIKQFYRDKYSRRIQESMNVDNDKLDKIEYTVETQEAEVRDPSNTPSIISNNILFTTAKYNVDPSTNKLDYIIAEILKKIKDQNQTPNYKGLPIKIALAVTGYADEQEIRYDLAFELKQKFSDLRNFPLNSDVLKESATQKLLNEKLSQLRAEMVFEYIKKEVTSKYTSVTFSEKESFASSDAEFLQTKTGALGRGWAIPSNIKPCKDKDCPERRVVYVSHVVFPESKSE